MHSLFSDANAATVKKSGDPQHLSRFRHNPPGLLRVQRVLHVQIAPQNHGNRTAAGISSRDRTLTGRIGRTFSLFFFKFGSDIMSIFGKIMGAIFGTKAEAATAGTAADASAGSGAAAGSTAAASAAPAQSVDIVPILEKAAAAKKEKLNWRTSIVDLMKVLDLDSSLAARKELAKELGYTGDTNDSAKMNIWLHKQVMIKVAANGGKVPAELT
jgi:hypothetical protein